MAKTGRPATDTKTLRRRGSWLAAKRDKDARAKPKPDIIEWYLHPPEPYSVDYLDQLMSGHASGRPCFGEPEGKEWLDEYFFLSWYSEAQLAAMQAAWAELRGGILEFYHFKWGNSVRCWASFLFDDGLSQKQARAAYDAEFNKLRNVLKYTYGKKSDKH